MIEQVYARCKIHFQRFQLKVARSESDGFDVGLPLLNKIQDQILCGEGEGGELMSILLASIVRAPIMLIRVHGEVGIGHHRLVQIFDYPVRKDFELDL